MIVGNAVQLTFKQIARNPMRSALTTLGILIGVAAVIVMLALGRGASVRISNELSGLGQNLLFLVPGTPGQGGPGARGTARPFDVSDANVVRHDITGLSGVAPTVVRAAVAVNGTASWRTQITGTTADYLQVMSWRIASGRELSDAELRSGASVCLVGATVQHELFGVGDPVGSSIRVGNVSLRVVGTLVPKGQSTFGQDQDNFILMPLATHQRRITGSRDVDVIFLSAARLEDSDRIKVDVEALMRLRRHIGSGDVPDFFVRDMKEVAQTVSSVTGVLTSLLAAIAAVSLLVGGIGIMNIMLVAVSERTREIGIRLAIGARSRDVLAQFLVEAVTLSAVGGTVGVLLGLLGSYAATRRLNLPLVLDPVLIALPFGFAAFVGIVFGFFPARKAARMSPIEALRHE